MSLDLNFVVQTLGPPLAGTGEVPSSHTFSTVTTDSRKAGGGSLFVAIPGDRFDGHDFADAAIAAGAAAVLVRKQTKLKSKTAAVFEVADTVEAYRKLANAWRARFKIPVAVVAGSVGKTTTKELLAAILSGKLGPVLKTEGSQNGFVGIPMTLLELKPSHRAAVVEVGIDEIGAMEKHMGMVGATTAVLTTIGPEHLEKLRDVPTVAHEESLALSHVAEAGGLVAINLDDPWIAPLLPKLRGARTLSYSLQGKVEAPGIQGQFDEASGTLQFAGEGLDALKLSVPLPGRHNALNLLAAVAVARGMGLTAADISFGLASFRGGEGRSQRRDLADGTLVLCDYYNSSPPSLQAALTTLAQLGKGRETWACLGDMLELGPGEEGFHRAVADGVLAAGVQHLLLYGPRMKFLESELKSRGYTGSVDHFDSHAKLAERLIGASRPGAAVLIKGSRGMKMEEVWKLLEARPRSAS